MADSPVFRNGIQDSNSGGTDTPIPFLTQKSIPRAGIEPTNLRLPEGYSYQRDSMKYFPADKMRFSALHISD